MARDRLLDIEAVSRFNKDCRDYLSAMPYCNGIANYLYGVMAKERSSDSGLKHEDYIPKFLRSSYELSGINRPFARSVRSLVAFQFNQFDDAWYLAPEGALRHAAGAFSVLLQGLPWHVDDSLSSSAGAVEDLLTDQDTLQILADASHGIVFLKTHANELLERLGRASSEGYDHMKRVLLACEALAERDEPDSHSKARTLARTMASRPETSAWANEMLVRLSAK